MDVSWGHEQPCDAIHDKVGDPSHSSTDDRSPDRKGLQDRVPERLVPLGRYGEPPFSNESLPEYTT